MSEIRRVGIVGDGQLGRMIVEDGLRYNPDLEFTALGTAGQNSPAAQVGARQLDGELTDADAIRQLVEQSDVTTWEIEHINANALITLEDEGHNIQPSPRSLATIQDKLAQKTRLQKHGIDVAPFMRLDDADDLEDVRHAFGESFIAKARRGGYDGRSNLSVNPGMDWDVIRDFKRRTGNRGIYAERIVPFQRELAVVGARNMEGRVRFYPVVQTVHNANHVCEKVFAAANVDEKVRQVALQLGRETLHAFRGAGVFAVEMFQDEDDNVLVNEVAPRVHNSGHWTDLGAETSQFEQHVRAITGAQLGSTQMRVPSAVMLNILGTANGSFEPYMTATRPVYKGQVRWYGKSPRPGTERKIGHITAFGDDPHDALSNAESIAFHYAQ